MNREHLEISWVHVNHQSLLNEATHGLLADMMQGKAGRGKELERT